MFDFKKREEFEDRKNKTYLNPSYSKYYFPFILVILFLIICLLFLFFFNKPVKSHCSDGTDYNSCSLRKPYFCDNGNLIEKSSKCRCPKNMSLSDDSCFSSYKTKPKIISLKYTLRNEENQILFPVYNGVMDYISELPSSMELKENFSSFRGDFKLRNINDLEQEKFLSPLVVKIQNLADNKKDQMRIAVSIVQNIPFGQSNKTVNFFFTNVNYSRYPYEVLYENEGVCGEKSELLSFLLKEIGYETVIFYNIPENHESVGIKCPLKYSFKNTGYCMIETTGPAIISDNNLEYINGIKLNSYPEIIKISAGFSLGEKMYEYNDAKDWNYYRELLEEQGVNVFQENRLKQIKMKYGLVKEYRL